MPAEVLVREASKRVYYHKELITRSRIERYISNISSPSRKRAFRRISENMVPKFTRKEIETIIDCITVDVLIIYGTDDKIIPRYNIERLHKAIEQSTLELFEACGHAPHEEYPEKTADKMKTFISGDNSYGRT
jgi:alpha-beta hydrolase superfamily lysophospholipase